MMRHTASMPTLTKRQEEILNRCQEPRTLPLTFAEDDREQLTRPHTSDGDSGGGDNDAVLTLTLTKLKKTPKGRPIIDKRSPASAVGVPSVVGGMTLPAPPYFPIPPSRISSAMLKVLAPLPLPPAGGPPVLERIHVPNLWTSPRPAAVGGEAPFRH